MSDCILVIDTEQYAGNFERPLTAWMTGQVGECGVGATEQSIAQSELPPEVLEWCDENIRQVPDDHGCFRPTAIQPTPGWYNTGMGVDYQLGDDPDQVLQKHLKEVRAYWEPHIEVARERIAAGENVERCKRDLERYEKEIAESQVGRYPAYHSVGIFLSERPPQFVLDVLKERAYSFNDRPGRYEWDFDINITGFRLVTEKVVRTSEPV